MNSRDRALRKPGLDQSLLNVLPNYTTPHEQVRDHQVSLAVKVTAVGGWRLNDPIPALHSDLSPQVAGVSSCCLAFTTVATVTCAML